MLPLPGYDREGRKVLFGRWGIYDPKHVSMDEVIRTCSIIFDLVMEEDEQCNLTGIVLAGDCTGLSLSHAMAFTPAIGRKSMVFWQVGQEETNNQRKQPIRGNNQSEGRTNQRGKNQSEGRTNQRGNNQSEGRTNQRGNNQSEGRTNQRGNNQSEGRTNQRGNNQSEETTNQREEPIRGNNQSEGRTNQRGKNQSEGRTNQRGNSQSKREEGRGNR
ncbi:hypothetical protein Pmani_025948 [Petrolisthes manimaculis]|uniref:CRAL-TRIO domain-containing protein n=1 Tax=Petrolisthes manimaculis TaxID=1843537 RepID=A0AAE1U0M6_9EUCA|nr:hypothetical protein Pmani_025948 [Petrolisthes manimaculis]